MKIIEKKNKDGLEITQVKMNCDNQLMDNKKRKPPSCLPQTSGFLICINGFSGSGKTTTLINLLTKKNRNNMKKSYRGCFNRVIFVSPSAHTIENKEIQELEHKHEQLTHELFDEIDEMCEKNIDNDDDECENYCLVLDDVGAMIRANKTLETRLCMLCNNRRHKRISIFILTQQIMQIPPPIRKNLTWLITYKPKTFQEKDCILKEFSDIRNPKDLEQLFNFIYKSKRDFMIVDCSLKHSANIEYYRNFNKLNIENDYTNDKCSNNILDEYTEDILS